MKLEKPHVNWRSLIFGGKAGMEARLGVWTLLTSEGRAWGLSTYLFWHTASAHPSGYAGLPQVEPLARGPGAG